MNSRLVCRTFNTSLLALVLVPGIALAQTQNTTPPTDNTPRIEIASAPAPAKAPRQAAPYRWSGFYIGGQAGYGGGKADTSFAGVPDGVFSPSTLKPDTMGWAYGFYGGADFQAGIFVGGVEVDVMFSNMDGSIQQSTFNFNGAQIDGELGAAQAIDWYSTVRGRAGIAVGGCLFYGTAGIVIERVDHRSNASQSAVPAVQFPVNQVDNMYGLAIGGGVEGRFTRLISWRAQYLYLDGGETSVVADPIPSITSAQVRHTWNSTSNVFTAGIGFRF